MGRQFNVTGMSCAACSARVEKAVSKVDGVSQCSVNLLTNSMTVEGTTDDSIIISAVKKAGYGASVKGKSGVKEQAVSDNSFKNLLKRLISSLIFLIIMMYISMGHSMWGFPVPSFLDGNHIASGIIQLILCCIITFINRQFYISGFKGIINRSPNMDSLVSIGAGASLSYSIYSLLALTSPEVIVNPAASEKIAHGFYFESAAMILTLITFGKLLETYSKGKTTNAIDGLKALTPDTATVIRNNSELTISVSDIMVNDIFIVKTGESMPADGIIIEGSCAVNESALTGESIPKEKSVGDSVSAATINQSGFIKCRATNIGDDTLISKIIRMVSDAASAKAPIAKVADKISGVFVPTVISIAVVTFIIWLIISKEPGFALSRAVAVLVISCPCALGLATPVAIMVANGVGAKNGILFKTATALEHTGRSNIVVFDKTGTITNGTPEVTDILPAETLPENKLLSLAYSLEIKSSHPLALAICTKAESENCPAYDVNNFTESIGGGISAEYNGNELSCGNRQYIEKNCELTNNAISSAERLADNGKTPLFVSYKNQLAGIIAVADTIKPDSRDAINELKAMGLRTIMLTGDNKKTANAIKTQVGIDETIAEVLPDTKATVITRLKEEGHVIMVGDGINDAPALTTADIGIAIGSGTDIAIDAADVVLMKNAVSDVAAAIKLSRTTLRNIYENLFWAFIYNILSIPIAAGVLIPTFNIELNPMIAAAAMSLSSFFVVSNSLRLNFAKIYKTDKSRKEVKSMEKVIKVDGMMCPHCEAHVKKALEAIDGVVEAIPSHTEKNVIIKLSCDVKNDTLEKAITDCGYTVL